MYVGDLEVGVTEWANGWFQSGVCHFWNARGHMLLLGWDTDQVALVVCLATMWICLSGTRRLLRTQQLDISGSPYRRCVCQVNAGVLEGKAQPWTTPLPACLNIEDRSTLGLFLSAYRARRDAVFFAFYIEALLLCLLGWSVSEATFSVTFVEQHENCLGQFVTDSERPGFSTETAIRQTAVKHKI